MLMRIEVTTTSINKEDLRLNPVKKNVTPKTAKSERLNETMAS